MKRYTTAQARKQFAELLDAAERGQDVVIERRGVLFVLHAGPFSPLAPAPPCAAHRVGRSRDHGRTVDVEVGS